MAELLAIGTTSANSADFTVVAGAPKTLFIKSTANGPCHRVVFVLQHKQSDGATYQDVTTLDSGSIRSFGNVVGAGTYRVQRRVSESGQAAGMDIEG